MAARKVFQPLTTPAGANEQNGVGQITVTASGSAVSRGIASGASRALFFLDVSAASGTSPSLTVKIQGQDPGSLKWQDICSFPAQAAVTPATPLAPIEVDPLYYQQIRATWTVSGTSPSFTFSCGALLMAEGTN